MDDVVSVCIPVYNGGKYLRDCLESIVGQTYTKLEILILDDGSSDNSIAIAENFARIDSRVKLVINRVNLGLAGNWLQCIELATGKWIKFLFQDDLMQPQCVEKMLAACVQYKSPVCICSREFLIENSASDVLKNFFSKEVYKLEDKYPQPGYLAPDVIATLAAQNLFTNFVGEPITLLFEKKLVQAYGSYNKDLVQLIDYEFALRLSLNVGSCFLPDKLVSFRVHSSSESSNQNANALKKLKNQFVEPLLLYHEYLFNPNFKALRQAYNTAPKKLLKDALYFYKYRSKEFALPAEMKKYLYKKYKGLYLLALGKFIPKG
jgi:glycosyltransferase involved in cell wall biosynthesis